MKQNSQITVVAVANAIALTTEIVAEVAGNEVADTIQGSVVSKAGIADMVASIFARKLSAYTRQPITK